MNGSKANPSIGNVENVPVRFSLKRFFVVLTFVVLVFALVTWLAKSIHYAFVDGPLNCYATMYGAGTVRSYLQRNGDHWPKSWEDLRPIYEERYKLGENALEFDEMKERLQIDFDVDPRELSHCEVNSDGPPFRVIRLRNGQENYWEGAEPNTLILEYLKAKF